MPEVMSPADVLFWEQPLNVQNIQRLRGTDVGVRPIANYPKHFPSVKENKMVLTPFKHFLQ